VWRRNPPSKDSLQKMPLGKLSVFAYVVSRERSADQRKQLRDDAFHVKTGRSAKNWLDPAKNGNRPKMLPTLFLHESLQLYKTVYTCTYV